MRRSGERHPKVKIPDADVRLMRELRQQGLTYREIAEKFECSIWTARDIVAGKTRNGFVLAAAWKGLCA